MQFNPKLHLRDIFSFRHRLCVTEKGITAAVILLLYTLARKKSFILSLTDVIFSLKTFYLPSYKICLCHASTSKYFKQTFLEGFAEQES